MGHRLHDLPGLQAHVQRDAGLAAHLLLGVALRHQGPEDGQLTIGGVQAGPGVHVSVGELGDVARQVGGDVPQRLGEGLRVLAGDLLQAGLATRETVRNLSSGHACSLLMGCRVVGC